MNNQKTNIEDLITSYLADVVAAIPNIHNINTENFDLSKHIEKHIEKYTKNSVYEFPNYSLEETINNYIYTFDVPGVKKEDINVTEKNKILNIKGVREQHNSTYKIKECYYGNFNRSLNLPDDVISDEINAKLNEGVLTVTIKRYNTEDEDKERVVDIL
jgi:HSP20 family protein